MKRGMPRISNRRFPEYLAPEGKAYVKSRRLSVEQAIELSHRYGGKAVLAHPAKLRMNATQAEGFVAYLKRVGLDGIEADYFAHTNVERDFFQVSGGQVRAFS